MQIRVFWFKVAPQLTISIVESEASRDEEYEETNVTDATQLSDDHINKVTFLQICRRNVKDLTWLK